MIWLFCRVSLERGEFVGVVLTSVDSSFVGAVLSWKSLRAPSLATSLVLRASIAALLAMFSTFGAKEGGGAGLLCVVTGTTSAVQQVKIQNRNEIHMEDTEIG